MKILATAAAMALAATGFFAEAQSSYARQFATAKPELDKLMASMQYSEVVGKIQSILPASIPDLPRDPANPQVTINNYAELGTIQDFHEILFKAQFASGNVEGAISTAKKAKEIATINAENTEADYGDFIATWKTAIETSKADLEELTQAKGQREEELKKVKGKKAKEIEGVLERINLDIVECERNLQFGPAAVAQSEKAIADAKREPAKFDKDIADMDRDLATEKAAIENEFKGDLGKYITAAIAPNTLSKFQNQKEKVRFLNRLLFLSPQNADVKKQIDLAMPK